MMVEKNCNWFVESWQIIFSCGFEIMMNTKLEGHKSIWIDGDNFEIKNKYMKAWISVGVLQDVFKMVKWGNEAY